MNTQTAKLIAMLTELKSADQEEIPELIRLIQRQYNIRKALPVIHGVLGSKYDSLLVYPSHLGGRLPA